MTAGIDGSPYQHGDPVTVGGVQLEFGYLDDQWAELAPPGSLQVGFTAHATTITPLAPACPDCRKPRLLDLFCCQGGATRGYQLAGFCVCGVDIDPQSRYIGDEFHQADAVQFVRDNLAWIRATFAAVHASPPCQADSDCQRIQGREHPRLIGPTRDVLIETGLPFVIENVGGAVPELRDPIMLCGLDFGLHTARHRFFETGGGFTFTAPSPPHSERQHDAVSTKMGRPFEPGKLRHYVDNFSGVAAARDDMQMQWANRDGLREAIPPGLHPAHRRRISGAPCRRARRLTVHGGHHHA